MTKAQIPMIDDSPTEKRRPQMPVSITEQSQPQEPILSVEEIISNIGSLIYYIKILNGEELISEVLVRPGNQTILLIQPLQIHLILDQKTNIPHVVLAEWVPHDFVQYQKVDFNTQNALVIEEAADQIKYSYVKTLLRLAENAKSDIKDQAIEATMEQLMDKKKKEPQQQSNTVVSSANTKPETTTKDEDDHPGIEYDLTSFKKKTVH